MSLDGYIGRAAKAGFLRNLGEVRSNPTPADESERQKYCHPGRRFLVAYVITG